MILVWSRGISKHNHHPMAPPADSLEIRSVTVNGKPMSWRENGEVSFGAGRRRNLHRFRRAERAPPPVRIRINWTVRQQWAGLALGYGAVTVRFYNAAAIKLP